MGFLNIISDKLFSASDSGVKKIGDQLWMTENLRVFRFQNGDPIPEAISAEEWKRAGEKGQPAWCHYCNDPNVGKKYGKLYNWYAVNDKRGLAPEGWRIPTQDDFGILVSVVSNDGNLLKAKGEGKERGKGTNTSGFSALMAGSRGIFGDFDFLFRGTAIWSSTEHGNHFACSLGLVNDNNRVYLTDHDDYKNSGLSVRCMKEGRKEPDRRGVEPRSGFGSVRIGGQVWMVDNLNVSCFRDGERIPEARADEDWKRAGEGGRPAWCHYQNDPAMGWKMGRLYNWHAVKDGRGLAPKGWHVPTVEEMKIVIETVANHSSALKAKGQGEGTGSGTNASGFSALLAGCRSFGSGFAELDRFARFWSSSEFHDREYAYHMFMNNFCGGIAVEHRNKDFGFSVRCIQD